MASEHLLRSDCGQKIIRARKKDLPQEQNPAICGAFKGALGRTRTCDLLIRGGRPTARRTSVAGEKGTKRSIYAPLVANLLIASSKFVVGFASVIFACSSGRSKDRGRPWS